MQFQQSQDNKTINASNNQGSPDIKVRQQW